MRLTIDIGETIEREGHIIVDLNSGHINRATITPSPFNVTAHDIESARDRLELSEAQVDALRKRLDELTDRIIEKLLTEDYWQEVLDMEIECLLEGM